MSRLATFSHRHRDKLLPMVVSLPLFLQNIDASIMGPALPAMSASLQVNILRLNLAITAYLVSLAIFLPASGWLADRFGPRRVFCMAITVFSLASGLCALANSLEMLVACRVLQGLGGAMMVPVGRLILLRSIAPSQMITAMVWFTVPPVIGRLLGPLVGGAMVTWLSWPWIFLINVPIGALAIALSLTLMEEGEAPEAHSAFDGLGFLLLGAGLAALLAALESAGSGLLPGRTAAALAVAGAGLMAAYVAHSRRRAQPLIDLGILRYPTFFTAVVGGAPLRLAIGALPFLLPLLLQLGFGLSPLDAGLLTVATALGSLATRALLTRALRRWGFRRLLLVATVCASGCYLAYSQFRVTTPHAALFAATAVGGLVMSMVIVSLQTIAFTQVPKPLLGQATALSTIVQQVSLSVGVVLATEGLRLAVWVRGGSPGAIVAADFPPVFMAIAAVTLLGLFSFRRLPPDVGDELRHAR